MTSPKSTKPPYATMIRALRKRDQVTLKVVAEAVAELSGESCSISAVSKWQRGENPPSYLHAKALEEMFDIPNHELMNALDYPPANANPTRQDIIDRIDRLEEAISRIVDDAVGDDGELSKVLDQMLTTMAEQTAAIAALARRDATPARGAPSPMPARPASPPAVPSGRRPDR